MEWPLKRKVENEAVDLYGEPFTYQDSFLRFKARKEDTFDGSQSDAYNILITGMLEIAATKGKWALVAEILRQKLDEALKQVMTIEGFEGAVHSLMENVAEKVLAAACRGKSALVSPERIREMYRSRLAIRKRDQR